MSPSPREMTDAVDPTTLTGKLTIAVWVSRWWNSGSYLRRRLIFSTGAALIVVLIALVVALLVT